MSKSLAATIALTCTFVYPILGIAEQPSVSQKPMPEQLVGAFNSLYGVHQLFLPGAVVPGIETAGPMIAVRSATYIVSLSRRAQAQ